MPDLLAHVLVAYALGTILSLHFGWLEPRYVTVVMVGSFIPDMGKIHLVIPGWRIESVFEVPFSWFALHTGGGVLIGVLIGGLLVVPRERLRVTALLSVGGASHLLTDYLLQTPTGRSFPILWPITRFRPPTPGLYLSTQLEPTAVAALFALLAYLLRQRCAVD